MVHPDPFQGCPRRWVGVVKLCVESLGLSTTDHTLSFVYVTEVLADDFPSVLAFLRPDHQG